MGVERPVKLYAWLRVCASVAVLRSRRRSARDDLEGGAALVVVTRTPGIIAGARSPGPL
jgi:hypothetical protein